VLLIKTNQIFATFLLVPSHHFRLKRCLHGPCMYSANISDLSALFIVLTSTRLRFRPTCSLHNPYQNTITIWDPHVLLTILIGTRYRFRLTSSLQHLYWYTGTISGPTAIRNFLTVRYELLFQTQPLSELSLLVPSCYFRPIRYFHYTYYYSDSTSGQAFVSFTFSASMQELYKSSTLFSIKAQAVSLHTSLNRVVYRVDICRKQVQ